jgi:hypothetical protein
MGSIQLRPATPRRPGLSSNHVRSLNSPARHTPRQNIALPEFRPDRSDSSLDLVGYNSDEGASFSPPNTPQDYTAAVKARYGPHAAANKEGGRQ